MEYVKKLADAFADIVYGLLIFISIYMGFEAPAISAPVWFCLAVLLWISYKLPKK